jgi:segregation and condensation protein B
MNEHYLRNVIEAGLLAAGRPVQPAELVQLFDESARPTGEQVRAALDVLAAEYGERGIELKETAGGVRIQVRRELAGEVSRLWPERPARYSRALLETLALIAYRQPITRGEIEAVRGVAVNPNIVKTLLERNWVRVVGHRDVPGRPELLGTTRDFLDYFGLRSLDELPPLSELKAVGDFNLQLNLAADAVDGARSGAGEAAAASATDAVGAQPAPVAPRAAAAESGTSAGSSSEPPTEAALLEESLLEESAENAAEDDDERDEGDELSAEGSDSRELVAAPSDNGD